MKNLITLLLITLLMANCEEGGDDKSASPSTVSTCNVCGDIIPNNKSELGDIAQYLIDNDELFDKWFHDVDPMHPDRMKYPDVQMVYGIRGYINGKAKVADHLGALDVLNTDPLTAFLESVVSPNGASQGLDRQGLCYMTAQVYESFGIDTEIIQSTGQVHDLAPDGNYCAVQLKLLHGDILEDPYLNRSFFTFDEGGLSAEQLGKIIQSNELDSVTSVPDGMANVPVAWMGNLGGYYHTYEDMNTGAMTRDEFVRDLHETIFNSIQIIDFKTL